MSDNPVPAGNAEAPQQEPRMLLIEPRGYQPPPIDLKEHEAKTARTIAITLIWMLGVTFVANILTLILLTVKNRLDAAPQFERMFAVWMPLLSGLVGSAVTFYLTKEKK